MFYQLLLFIPCSNEAMYVTVHEQIGHNAHKRENRVFLQHHSSGTTMSPELILGMAVIESISRSKREAYHCYRSRATALQSCGSSSSELCLNCS